MSRRDPRDQGCFASKVRNRELDTVRTIHGRGRVKTKYCREGWAEHWRSDYFLTPRQLRTSDELRHATFWFIHEGQHLLDA